MSDTAGSEERPGNVPDALDAIVIGAGFAGLYMVWRLREQGMSVRCSTPTRSWVTWSRSGRWRSATLSSRRS
jgi:cation diffusion facilitator CzcD-associated flavoprotein CzcO